MKHNRKNVMLILFACVIFFLLHLPSIHIIAVTNVPTYLDNMMTVYNNNLNPFLPNITSYKPPILFIVIAALFKIFGPSRELATLCIFILSTLSLYLTYYVGKNLFSEKTGVVAMLLLCCSPLFIHQSYLFQNPIPAIPLLLLAFYAYIKQKNILYLLVTSLLVLYKEPFALFPIYTAAFDRYINKRWRAYQLLYGSPIFLFFLWMGINKLLFGWFLDPSNITLVSFNLLTITRGIEHSITTSQYWFYISLLFFSYQFVIHKQPDHNKQSYIHLTIRYCIGYICLFSLPYLFFPFAPRYVLPVYPFIFLILSITITYNYYINGKVFYLLSVYQ